MEFVGFQGKEFVTVCDTPQLLKRRGFLGHARRGWYRPRSAPRALSEREQIHGRIVIAVER